MNKAINILSTLSTNEPLDEQLLLDYLGNKLTPAQTRMVEEWLANSPLASEAIEGLMNVPDKGQLKTIVKDLHHSLQTSLRKKHKRVNKTYRKTVYWFVISLAITLLICIIGFVVISMLHVK